MTGGCAVIVADYFLNPGLHVPNCNTAVKGFTKAIDAQTGQQGLLQRSQWHIDCCIYRLIASFAGTRQAFLPGGHRTGAPGKHVVRGTAKYRLIDEKVRIFIAPSIQEINNTLVSQKW